MNPYTPPETEWFQISADTYVSALKNAQSMGFFWGALIGSIAMSVFFALLLLAHLLL